MIQSQHLELTAGSESGRRDCEWWAGGLYVRLSEGLVVDLMAGLPLYCITVLTGWRGLPLQCVRARPAQSIAPSVQLIGLRLGVFLPSLSDHFRYRRPNGRSLSHCDPRTVMVLKMTELMYTYLAYLVYDLIYARHVFQECAHERFIQLHRQLRWPTIIYLHM